MDSKVWFYWGTLGDSVEPTLELSSPEREGTGMFIHQLPSVTSGGVLQGNWEVLTLKHSSPACVGIVTARRRWPVHQKYRLLHFHASFFLSQRHFQFLQMAHSSKDNATSSKKLSWSSDRVSDPSGIHRQSQHNYYKIPMFLPSGFAFTQLSVKGGIDD